MAMNVCLTTLVLLSSVWCQNNPDKGFCDKNELQGKFDIKSCHHEKDLVMTRWLPHGSSCIVECTSEIKKFADPRSGRRQCYQGNWIGHDIDCDEPLSILKNAPKMTKEVHLRKKRGFWRDLGCWLFGCRSGPPPDRTPPSLTCPPDITAYNTPIQTHADFTWTEPIAVDNKDGRVTLRRYGPSPGQSISANMTVQYVAKDSGGNMASCRFRITLIVIRCPPPEKIANGYYRCHPSTDFVMGGNCVFGCYNGHELEGPREVTCQNTWRWSDTFPVCKKIKCPLLLPPAHATMACSDGFNFRSVCSFTCVKEGYDITAGLRRVQVCKADGNWSGQTPSCADIAPPTISQCPYVVITTAERSSDQARVVWSDPQVNDNSRESITAVQSKGKSPGSVFTVGYHEIEYTATDGAGNVARKCQFKVVVKELTCHALYATPYQTITCPDGYRYGSECTFDCDADFSLAGSRMTSCEITGNPSNGIWSFPKQPVCEVANPCPKLRVPVNGAIVCDEWFQGIFCQLHCQNGTDISPRFPHWEHLVCGISGVWNIISDLHQQIPDCVARGSGALVRYVMKARYYYNGNCNDPDVQQEIKTNFIFLLENQPACLSVRDCQVQNVKVTCGEIRVKRDEFGHWRNRRNSNENGTVDIDVEFQFSSQSADKSDVDDWKSRVYTVTNGVVQSGQLTVDGVLLTSGSVINNEIDGECGNGSVINYRSLTCMKCPFGSFHNVTRKSCDLCPKGHFQDQEGQWTCKDCPAGKTTGSPGATNFNDCQASCANGTFSKTGLPPCSPCPPGFYQPWTGQTQCKECPGVKTTVSQGSASTDLCQDFDITFQPNDTSVPSLAILDVDINITSAVNITFWMKCTSSCQSTTLLKIDKNNEDNWFILDVKESVTFTIGSIERETTLTLNTNQWYFVILGLTTTSVTLWVDSAMSGSLDHQGFSYINLQKLTLGGLTFAGKISQLQIWSSLSADNADRTCNAAVEGDVLSWKKFTDAELQESFIDIPSQCDDEDGCATNPCRNGQCQDDLESFSCHCDTGWSGINCDVNVDDCIDNVCENNGTCVDDVNAFHCDCADNFGGEFCEIAIVDGEWGTWSNWTSCNVTCGQGSRARSRMCDDPYPDNGGRECKGEATQVEQCKLPDCIVCPPLDPPTNGDISCDVTPDVTNCSIFCEDGHMFDQEPLDQYICSVDTTNIWNFQTDLNPLRRLPHCSKIESAKRLGITYTGPYMNTESLSCDEDVSNMTSTLSDIITKEIQCFWSQTCNVSEVKVTLCQGRSKRDTSSNMLFSVDISIDSGSEDSAYVLQSAHRDIQTAAEAGLLDINGGNVAYTVDVNTTSSIPTIVCESGHSTYSFWCFPCGPGSHYKDGLCEWCPVGTYQQLQAESECVKCSQGWTTIGYGSRLESDCNVELPTTTEPTSTSDTPASTTAVSSTANVTDTNPMNERDKEVKTALISGLSSGLGVVVILLLVIIVIVFRNRCKTTEIPPSQTTTLTRQTNDFNSQSRKFDPLKTDSQNNFEEPYPDYLQDSSSPSASTIGSMSRSFRSQRSYRSLYATRDIYLPR